MHNPTGYVKLMDFLVNTLCKKKKMIKDTDYMLKTLVWNIFDITKTGLNKFYIYRDFVLFYLTAVVKNSVTLSQ